MQKPDKTVNRLMTERFGHDCLIAVATLDGAIPCVRCVDAYYENKAFYTVTYSLSGKMQQLKTNPTAAVCGEWFTGHGIGENLGWVKAPENREIIEKLRSTFAKWYSNGHIDEDDINTCILKITLTDGVLFADGDRYDIDFKE